MPMKPKPGESQSDFTSRCVPEMMGDGKRDNDQAVAICLDIWRNKEIDMRKRPQVTRDDDDSIPDPYDYDNYDEFLEDCLDGGNSEDACRTAYRERAPKDGIVHRTHAGKLDGTEFILSDETPDRMGDIIESAGWDLKQFKKNPIALFGHKADFPIGLWRNVATTKDGELRGHLELAPKGTSPRIDEIRALVDAGILRAVSVGFKPIDYTPLNVKEPFGGLRYSKQELVECSLVAVPANPNALSVAKSLKISDETQSLVFAKTGKGHVTKRAIVPGKPAIRTPDGKTIIMTPLTQRIADTQGRITALREALAEHLNSVDDSDVTEEQINKTTEFNNKIVQEERTLAMLVDSEKHIANATAADNPPRRQERQNGDDGNNNLPARRPFTMPSKKIDPLEYVVRAGTIAMFAHVHRRSYDEIRKEIYGDDEATKVFMNWAQRAASNPAMTTVTGWAAELVQQVVTSFMETLMPKSVFPRLSGYGLGLSFGRAGRIIIPTRARTPTIAGSFVGEGAPIPVRQGAFTSQTLTPKKMAVITTWTREIDEHSIPAIEGLLRQAIQEDTAVALDSVLLDANAATVIRPPGIMNGVTPLTPTPGGGFNALVGDIKQVSGALLTATAGHIRMPVWLMNPQQTNSIMLTAMPGMSAFPFRDEVARGQLQGWPIIDSGTVPLGEVVALDAADFVSITGEGPRFELSDQATLHMEDTAPLPIVDGTPATPVRSLWQTDSLALRLIMPLNWTIRRPGVVAAVTGVTW